MKISKTLIKKIVSIDEECSLCQPLPELSTYFFEILSKHRIKMLKWSGFASTIKTNKDAERWIKEIYFFNQGGQKFNSILVWKDHFAGMMALHRIDKANRRAEIGYWVNHDFQGNGLISRAMIPFLKHVFQTIDINRIDLIVGTENIKSISIADKTGFIKEGLMKEYFIINHVIHDAYMYRMLKSDFEQIIKI